MSGQPFAILAAAGRGRGPHRRGGTVPEISFITQGASLFALLIGGPIALRAQRRYSRVNTWRIVTCWGLFGAVLAVVYVLLTELP